MLKTPMLSSLGNPITALVAAMNKRSNSVREIEPGAVEIGHHSLDMLIWGRNAPHHYMGYPDLPADSDGVFLGCYGVCDTPEQFMDRYRGILQQDPRIFVIGFTHIHKDPSNAGNGGGWRWHKWGSYIGTGTPTTEYLDDEAGFDAGVYTYHVYQLEGPALKLDWATRQLVEDPEAI